MEVNGHPFSVVEQWVGGCSSTSSESVVAAANQRLTVLIGLTRASDLKNPMG